MSYTPQEQQIDEVVPALKKKLSEFAEKANRRIYSDDWVEEHKRDLKRILDLVFELREELRKL